jgi:dTMP kinase
VEIARKRLRAIDYTRPDNGLLDRFEQEHADFFERVQAGYHRRVQENPQRYIVINAAQTLDLVKAKLEEIISSI